MPAWLGLHPLKAVSGSIMSLDGPGAQWRMSCHPLKSRPLKIRLPGGPQC